MKKILLIIVIFICMTTNIFSNSFKNNDLSISSGLTISSEKDFSNNTFSFPAELAYSYIFNSKNICHFQFVTKLGYNSISNARFGIRTLDYWYLSQGLGLSFYFTDEVSSYLNAAFSIGLYGKNLIWLSALEATVGLKFHLTDYIYIGPSVNLRHQNDSYSTRGLISFGVKI